MAKIKHTKTELKAQREALKRFQRFLPMLQLKKQQLQMEIQAITTQIQQVESRTAEIRRGLDAWVRLLSEPVDLAPFVAIERIELDTGNIAGVTIPILKSVHLRSVTPDLFETPPWIDDAIAAIGRLVEGRIARETLEEQRRRVAEELRVTSQRVNLFEKIKIPECRENIRIIRIFLGDEQTAGVARGKIAKRRSAGAAVAMAAEAAS
ncbi:MAG: V-type ATP synthase subunit D [Lentisphaerae bacterium]|nr:V-type ATP synthase subunit D [Lentisphaerota bacterium]